MSEGERWVQRLIENPSDLALRTVYADWLEQSGEHERAAYTRASLQLHEAVSRLATASRRHDTAWSRAVRGGMVGEPHLAVVEHFHDREIDMDELWLHLLPESELDETTRAHIDRALAFLETFQFIYYGLNEDLERSLAAAEPSDGTQGKSKRKRKRRYETEGLTDEIAASLLFVAQNTPLLLPLAPASVERPERGEGPRFDPRLRSLSYDLSQSGELPKSIVISRVVRITYGGSDE